MGLAKKGSRLFVVGDAEYRWAVSPDSGYTVLVVESASDPGQRLEAYLDYETQPPNVEAVQITPAVVRRVVVRAVSAGWRPREKGLKPFRYDSRDS